MEARLSGPSALPCRESVEFNSVYFKAYCNSIMPATLPSHTGYLCFKTLTPALGCTWPPLGMYPELFSLDKAAGT